MTTQASTAVSVCLDGWRFVPHSYAIVNQFWCLALMARGDVTLYHRDAPYYRAHWKPKFDQFTPDQERKLRRIPAPSEDAPPDAVVRLNYPYDFSPSGARRTVVVGTAEFRAVPDAFIAGGVPLGQAHADSDAMIVTSSEWSRQGFIDSGADPARVHIVPFGFDPETFRPPAPEVREALRKRLGIEDCFAFLNVGTMTPNKGLDVLLRAFVPMIDRHPEARLVLKGLDPMYPSLRLFETVAGRFPPDIVTRLQSRVLYIGEELSFPNMADLYGAADAYVSPYMAEGFNMPVLEAAACGLPVICTAGGPTDAFVTEAFGRLIASETAPTSFAVPQSDKPWPGMQLKPDADHLATLMDGIVGDRDFADQARRAGPDHVGARFTWAHSVDRLMAVLFPGG